MVDSIRKNARETADKSPTLTFTYDDANATARGSLASGWPWALFSLAALLKIMLRKLRGKIA